MAKEMAMNHWQHKNNVAEYGFFPTPLKVVGMEMELLDFSGLPSGFQLNVADLTGGEGEQLYKMHRYLESKGLSPISYYNEITQGRYETAKSKYGHIENYNLVNADLFRLRCFHKAANRRVKPVFHVLRNNPPYMWMNWRDSTVRSEELFLRENIVYNAVGGVQIMEVPLAQVSMTLLRMFTYRYENVHIFKFPLSIIKDHDFGQCIIIGRRKKQDEYDNKSAKMWQERILSGDISYLDEATKPIIAIEPNIKFYPVTLFRSAEINEMTLTNGLNQVLDNLFEKERQRTIAKEKQQIVHEKPIIEKLIGHRAIELNAGKFNGILGDVLIEGSTRKEIKETTETEGNQIITEEIEIIKPVIEITNANGDILLKEYED